MDIIAWAPACSSRSERKAAVPPVELPVVITDRSDDAARSTHGDYAFGDVSGDEAAGTDDGVVSERHPGHDLRPAADPYIRPDVYGRIIPDANLAVVNQLEIDVGVDPAAYMT
jgi:hypothetical protein